MKKPLHFYNEFDPYCAQWLRNLISAGEIPDGVVDERSIVDVQPEDLAGFAQCHFFAGVGGWSPAARLAGWPVDRELWTGSAPCQPFSDAGEQKGFDDERDLWPDYFRLIRARRPALAVGEQVSSAIGKHWLDRVHTDMATIGYSGGGGLVIPTCSINAPCRRDRLWWLFAPEGAVGHTNSARLERHAGDGRHAGERTHADRPVSPASVSLDRPWHDTEDWIGHDGKRRRLEPRSKPVGFGIPRSVEQLRAYGNAINPYLGAEVLAAWVECQP